MKYIQHIKRGEIEMWGNEASRWLRNFYTSTRDRTPMKRFLYKLLKSICFEEEESYAEAA